MLELADLFPDMRITTKTGDTVRTGIVTGVDIEAQGFWVVWDHSPSKAPIGYGANYAALATPVSDHKCDWLVERNGGEWNDYEPLIVDCGADAYITARGFHCDAGHAHVNLETRIKEGWDYAEDQGEAEALARAGVEPRDMEQGRVWM